MLPILDVRFKEWHNVKTLDDLKNFWKMLKLPENTDMKNGFPDELIKQLVNEALKNKE